MSNLADTPLLVSAVQAAAMCGVPPRYCSMQAIKTAQTGSSTAQPVQKPRSNCASDSAQQIRVSFFSKFGCMSDAANATSSIDAVIGHDEELITLTQAAKCLPRIDGRKVSVCTLWRWCRKGLRGVFLRYVRVGRRVCTTQTALLQFFTALAELDQPSQRQAATSTRSQPRIFKRRPISSSQRQRALAEADAVLERAGI
jgi:hypothetical protein